MKVIYSREFAKDFRKLPIEIQKLFRKQEALLKKNWKDSRLKVKKLIEHRLAFSFRVTRDYRVLFAFVESETILLANIGHRKDIYD